MLCPRLAFVPSGFTACACACTPPFLQITALLSMLRAMAERRAAGQAASLPRRVYCIWAARTLGEFKSLDAPLLDAAG